MLILAPFVLALGALSPNESRAIELVGMLPDGSVLYIDDSRLLARLDPHSGEELDRPSLDTGVLFDVSLHPLGARLAWIDAGQHLTLSDLDGGNQIGPFKVPGTEMGAANRVDWTHDGSYLVTWVHGRAGSDTGALRSSGYPVRIWTPECELVWEGPSVRDFDLHPERREFCLCAADRSGTTLWVGWPEEAGGECVDVVPLDGAVLAAAFSPDGARIAVTGSRLAADRAGRKSYQPWLWTIEAATRELQFENRITGVDPMGLMSRCECVEWSPDGRWLGVSLGKGHAPGILSATDGSTQRSGNFRGGRMNESFPVVWTRSGSLLSFWPTALFLNPDPKVAAVELPWMTRTDALSIEGTDEVLLVVVRIGRSEGIARVDTGTGTLVWARPDDVPGPEKERDW